MYDQPVNPLPEQSPITSSDCGRQPSELSQDERASLVALAHHSIAAFFDEQRISFDPPTAHLAQPRGVFTTLYLDGQLRGCVGYIYPVESLYRTVAETARAAAFEDTRFYPVTADEVPNLKVHLSVLSPLRVIQPDEVEIGRHGLLVSMGGRRGLLLPQVATEHGWDRETFLEQTCYKAGLPATAWKMGATLEAFTAETFGDPDTH